MEGITQIEKTVEDIERCKALIKKVIPNDLNEETWDLLTKDIMDTALFIGGDFLDDNITNIAQQYLTMGGLERFLKTI